jgi:hypothetical protein
VAAVIIQYLLASFIGHPQSYGATSTLSAGCWPGTV